MVNFGLKLKRFLRGRGCLVIFGFSLEMIWW